MDKIASMGEVVREARQRAGLTQRAVADRLGVSGPHVSEVEQGTRTLPLARWPALVAAVPGLRMADVVLAATTTFLTGPAVEAVAQGLWADLSTEARLDMWRQLAGVGPDAVPEDEAQAMRYACAPATWLAYAAAMVSRLGSAPVTEVPDVDPATASGVSLDSVLEAAAAGGPSLASGDDALVDFLLGDGDELGSDGMGLVALGGVMRRLGRDATAAEVVAMAARAGRLALALATAAGRRGYVGDTSAAVG